MDTHAGLSFGWFAPPKSTRAWEPTLTHREEAETMAYLSRIAKAASGFMCLMAERPTPRNRIPRTGQGRNLLAVIVSKDDVLRHHRAARLLVFFGPAESSAHGLPRSKLLISAEDGRVPVEAMADYRRASRALDETKWASSSSSFTSLPSNS